MKEEVFLDAPNLGELEKEYLINCIDSTFVSTVGPYVPEFENKFAEYIGIQGAVAVQSGTAAIHLALHALGIGPGDEVIVPSLTFIASVNPILYVGAKPVIVDVDKDTMNLDPFEVERGLTSKTKAIIPVHLFGNPCQMDAIHRIADENNLYIIEDATESLGATFMGKYTGNMGDYGCFSFNGNKLITTGGGGMIVANDIERCKKIKFLANQARDATKGYYHPEVGFNYRMTNIEAALGIAQWSRLETFLARKKKINEIYHDILGTIKGMSMPKEYDGAKSSYWLNSVIFEEKRDIEKLQKKLMENGIPTRRVFMPVSEMPYLKNYARPCPNAIEIYERGLCLPSSTLNSVGTTQGVAHSLRRLL